MNYTPKQLREWADNKAEVRWLADQLRAHADALEEIARLKGLWFSDAAPDETEYATEFRRAYPEGEK